MRIKLNLQIFIFIIIFILTHQIEIYCWLMLFAFLHEMGHMLMGIILGFKPKFLHIMPFGLTISFESTAENTHISVKIKAIKRMIVALSRICSQYNYFDINSIFTNSIRI